MYDGDDALSIVLWMRPVVNDSLLFQYPQPWIALYFGICLPHLVMKGEMHEVLGGVQVS